MNDFKPLRRLFQAGALVGICTLPVTALATPISPGFDLFETGDGATVDLTGVGLGIIQLEGTPIGADTGSADTIVLRKQGVNPFNDGDTSPPIEIELVALHLVSVSPVDLSALGGPLVGVQGDLHITLNREIEDIGAAGGNDDGVCDTGETCEMAAGGLAQPDALAPSIGRMQITHGTGVPGGTFDSCFGELSDPNTSCGLLGVTGGGIFTDAIFTVVGGDPGIPGDVLVSQPAPRVVLGSADTPWSHNAPPHYPDAALFPAGDFYAAVDPVTGDPVIFEHDGPHPRLVPPVPEPPALALFAAGLGLLGAIRRRRLRQV